MNNNPSHVAGIMKLSSFIIILIFQGMLSFTQAQSPEPIVIPDDLRAVLDNYERYWEAQAADSLASLFTENGYILRSGHEITQGRSAIAEAYKNSGGQLDLRVYDYSIEGSIAYIIGGYAGHEDWPDAGKYTLVLKKVNNRWLIHSDMDNRIKR